MTTRKPKHRPATNVRFTIAPNGTVVRTCDDEGVFDNGSDIGRYLAWEKRRRDERHCPPCPPDDADYGTNDPIEVSDADYEDYNATCEAWEEP